MHYRDALEWIHSLYRFGSQPGLERIEALLQKLGDPQRSLRCVHITGTNGKGSTAALMASMLEAQGCRVGLYTSPYLESFTNRMAVDGRDVEEDTLVRLVERIKPLVDEVAAAGPGQPTEFEVVTAMAFTYFAEQAPDWVVAEVGLGGRLDATNVIRPDVCVITNIGLEHTEVLGNTLEAIAYEKAGIIKTGVPVVTAAEKPPALAVIEQIALERGSSLTVIDRDVTYSRTDSSLDGQTFAYRSTARSLQNLNISLLGGHQVRNACTALAARELLDLPFSEQAVRDGLAAARWPGRMEVFSRTPLVLVDGAHNIDGIKALREALGEILGDRKLHLVLGILGDKAVDEILALIAPLATAELTVTRPENPRAACPHDVARMAARYTDAKVSVVENVAEAVSRALAATGPEEALCISGSLYTVSEAREALKAGR